MTTILHGVGLGLLIAAGWITVGLLVALALGRVSALGGRPRR